MTLRALSMHACAAAAGLTASTALDNTGPSISADATQDVAYALGYATPGVCCIVVIGIVVFILVRRANKR